MHPAVMQKVHIYLPPEHIKIIKEIAKHEGITFAEMTRRCLHLGLRAIVEDHDCKADAVLHWLDLAGQQGAAVNRHFIRDVHPTQVQVDELWSFVKKHKSICNRVTLPTGVTPGCGVRAPCRVISAS